MDFMLAVASGVAADPTIVLLQYGVLGVVALCLGSFAFGAYKRERDHADRVDAALQAANDRLIAANEKAAEKFAEVLAQTRDALLAANEYLRDLDLSTRGHR